MGRCQRYNPPREYDLTRLPAQARDASLAVADHFPRLPVHQQRIRILQAVVGGLRARARRAGHPEPIILEAKVKPLPGGGFVLDQDQPMVPLRPEYGGDGRTVEDARAEERAKAKQPTLEEAAIFAAEIAEVPAMTPKPKPKRRARGR